MLDSLADLQLALDVLAHVTRMVDEKLVEGTSGNISARAAEREAMIITPGSYPYQSMTIGDLLKVDVNTLNILRGFRPVSSEAPMHAAVYRLRPDVGAIIHTHSRYATAWSTLGRPLPAIHYVINSVGNEVPLVPYVTYGTEELARAAADRLLDHNAALLQNHGVIAVGTTLADAFKNAVRVEFLAQEMLILGLDARPHLLTAEDLDKVRERSRRKSHPV